MRRVALLRHDLPAAAADPLQGRQQQSAGGCYGLPDIEIVAPAGSYEVVLDELAC